MAPPQPPLRGLSSRTEHFIPRVRHQARSTQQPFSTWLLHFIPPNASLHISLSDPFLYVLLCLHSHFLFLCPHIHSYLSPLVFPFVSSQVSPPGSPVPNSYYSHSNMSEQKHHVILIKLKVLASDRLFPSIAEPSEASCDCHWHQPYDLSKLCWLCPIQRTIFYPPIWLSQMSHLWILEDGVLPLWLCSDPIGPANPFFFIGSIADSLNHHKCWPMWRLDLSIFNLLKYQSEF